MTRQEFVRLGIRPAGKSLDEAWSALKAIQEDIGSINSSALRAHYHRSYSPTLNTLVNGGNPSMLNRGSRKLARNNS